MAESDDFFAATDVADVDSEQQTGPTDEQVVEQAFDEGVNQSLGLKDEGIAENQAEQPAPALIAGMTEDELKALLDKAKLVDQLQGEFTQFRDKAFGTIGNLKQQLGELSQSRAGQAQVSADSFKALTDYFGDDSLAQALAQDLSGISIGGGQPVDIDAVLNERVSQIQIEFEKKLLSFSHPDWQDIAATDESGAFTNPEFVTWVNSLKPEAKQVVLDSYDAVSLSRALSSFKDWRSKKAESAAQKEHRLQDAIQPGGRSGPATKSSEDYFSQGLKKVISQRGMR